MIRRFSSLEHDLEQVIIDEMKDFTHVLCASAWLTNRRIIASMNQKNSKAVVGNDRQEWMTDFGNIDVRIFSVDDCDDGLMHMKFMILGKNGSWRTIIKGTYNFTQRAKRNIEEIEIHSDCDFFVKQFRALWDMGGYKYEAPKEKVQVLIRKLNPGEFYTSRNSGDRFRIIRHDGWYTFSKTAKGLDVIHYNNQPVWSEVLGDNRRYSWRLAEIHFCSHQNVEKVFQPHQTGGGESWHLQCMDCTHIVKTNIKHVNPRPKISRIGAWSEII